VLSFDFDNKSESVEQEHLLSMRHLVREDKKLFEKLMLPWCYVLNVDNESFIVQETQRDQAGSATNAR